MRDLCSREDLCFRELAERLPLRPNGRPHTAAMLRRWHLHGCGGIYLEARKLGSAYYASEDDVRRFGEACAERERENESLVTTPTQRRRLTADQIRRNEIALAKLRKAGMAV